jgi:O-methyltransferase
MTGPADNAEMIGRAHPEVVYAARAGDAAHYQVWAGEHPMYAPWSDDAQICDDLQDVETLTLNDRPRLYFLAALARHAARLNGGFAECGVFRGGTALLLSRVTAPTGTPLHLFDSFEGLPQPDGDQDIFYRRGDFGRTDAEMVAALLIEDQPRVHVHKGWIPRVFDEAPDLGWALVHVDVDLYRPTLDACEFFYDRMVPGGLFVFDEYGFPTCRGERNAVDEFFHDRPESPIVLPTGQAFVIKHSTASPHR